MTRSQTSPAGRLRVDVPSSLALFALIPALPDFHARYPDITLDLGVSDRPCDLVAENVDCAIRGRRPRRSQPDRPADRRDTPRALRRPSYIADRGMPTHPDELAHGHKVVGYFSARTGRRIAFDVMRGAESYDLDLPYAMATNDSTAYLAAALEGSASRRRSSRHPALYRVRRAGARAAGVDQHPAHTARRLRAEPASEQPAARLRRLGGGAIHHQPGLSPAGHGDVAFRRSRCQCVTPRNCCSSGVFGLANTSPGGPISCTRP